ncbi:MAG: hypothetical protein QXT73_01260 [Candidatus Methanomethylicaceae archaeon]
MTRQQLVNCVSTLATIRDDLRKEARCAIAALDRQKHGSDEEKDTLLLVRAENLLSKCIKVLEELHDRRAKGVEDCGETPLGR